MSLEKLPLAWWSVERISTLQWWLECYPYRQLYKSLVSCYWLWIYEGTIRCDDNQPQLQEPQKSLEEHWLRMAKSRLLFKFVTQSKSQSNQSEFTDLQKKYLLATIVYKALHIFIASALPYCTRSEVDIFYDMEVAPLDWALIGVIALYHHRVFHLLS